ncbi:MAG TPA: DUF6697 family protein [Verrucomicrobiae bacterium]|nr:DUF6697 family protein [Verrucomicrobiae bacterium]
MNANELKHGQAYDCTMDGDSGIEKTCIVPLSADAKTKRRYIINDAQKLRKENPDLFRRLLAMSFNEIVDEDIDGGPDRKRSSHVWRFTVNEQGSLYYEDYDLYLSDFVETVWQDPPAFVLGHKYTRVEISKILGGSEIDFLPTEKGKVVCGCFTLDHNPDAPNVVLPGTGSVIERRAKIFCEQEYPVPIFIKRRVNEWEYVGNYKPVRNSTDLAEVAAHHKGSITPLSEVTRVIFLQRSK